jgi:uncharacterized membrane protein YoaK (UPF0700 family)
MVKQGLRAIYEPDAICLEEPNEQATKELAVRVRIITQTFADLWRNREFLNPFHCGFYAVHLLSHKVMRYLVPLFLLLILATTALLATGSVFYTALFIGQIVFYFAAAVSSALVRLGVNSRWLGLPQYFVIGNLASLLALFKLIRGEHYTKWEPIRETRESTRIKQTSL